MLDNTIVSVTKVFTQARKGVFVGAGLVKLMGNGDVDVISPSWMLLLVIFVVKLDVSVSSLW